MTDPTPADAPRKVAPANRTETGPFDESEANPVRPYIDLGGIKILPREGLNLRLEVEDRGPHLLEPLVAAGRARRDAEHALADQGGGVRHGADDRDAVGQGRLEGVGGVGEDGHGAVAQPLDDLAAWLDRTGGEGDPESPSRQC